MLLVRETFDVQRRLLVRVCRSCSAVERAFEWNGPYSKPVAEVPTV